MMEKLLPTRLGAADGLGRSKLYGPMRAGIGASGRVVCCRRIAVPDLSDLITRYQTRILGYRGHRTTRNCYSATVRVLRDAWLRRRQLRRRSDLGVDRGLRGDLRYAGRRYIPALFETED